jgi:hypothetical protein
LRNYLARRSVLCRLATSLRVLDRFRAVNTASTDPALFMFLEASHLTYIDPLPVLTIAVRHHEIYPFNDGHPMSLDTGSSPSRSPASCATE